MQMSLRDFGNFFFRFSSACCSGMMVAHITFKLLCIVHIFACEFCMAIVPQLSIFYNLNAACDYIQPETNQTHCSAITVVNLPSV